MSIISNIRGAECVICALFYDCRGAYGIKPAGSDYSRLPTHIWLAHGEEPVVSQNICGYSYRQRQ